MNQSDDDDDMMVCGARTTPVVVKETRDYTGVPNLHAIIDINQFNQLVEQDPTTMLESMILENRILNRFSLWRLLLGVYKSSHTIDEKLECIQQHRRAYIETEPVKQSDPLSKTPQVWNNFFQTNELKHQIKIDVERTYSDKEFFQNLKVKQLLTNILFNWSKKHSDVSYQQGMNEVAASVIYVYFQELQGMGTSNQLLDVKYAEEDIYIVVEKILYDCKHMEMFRSNSKSRNSSPILSRVAKIQDVHLKLIDFELFKHLKMLQVELQVFLLRWLRCLFTREFHLDDSFRIWDAIFLEYYQNPINNPLNLMDCIAMAMMVYVKSQIIQKDDQSECLQRFLKYPPIEDVNHIIRTAFQYRELLNNPTVPINQVYEPKEPVIFEKPTIMATRDVTIPASQVNQLMIALTGALDQNTLPGELRSALVQIKCLIEKQW